MQMTVMNRTLTSLMVAGQFMFVSVHAQEQASSARSVPPDRTISVPGGELPTYDELPEGLRREHDRPDLEIHSYDPDPAKRFVMINGFRGREGMPIGRELWVHEIRPDGVVMRVQDRFFFIEN